MESFGAREILHCMVEKRGGYKLGIRQEIQRKEADIDKSGVDRGEYKISTATRGIREIEALRMSSKAT